MSTTSPNLYSNMVFIAICFYFDRFREAYDSLHAPYEIQGMRMKQSRVANTCFITSYD